MLPVCNNFWSNNVPNYTHTHTIFFKITISKCPGVHPLDKNGGSGSTIQLTHSAVNNMKFGVLLLF